MFSQIKKFFNLEKSSALLLFSFAGIALYMANSQWHNLYSQFVHFPVSINLSFWSLTTDFHHIINEGLMALFFLLVGMEVKKELVDGELSSPKKAALPIIAALGGFVVPALIYYFFNYNSPETLRGWSIPVATDIAFALGAFHIISKRVPLALKVFLLSLAIIDDIFAVLVIALFYSKGISGPFLAGIVFVCIAIYLYFKLELRNRLLFSLLAIALWMTVYNSGLHATLSGVILGFLIPHKKLFSAKEAINAVSKVFSKKKEATNQEIKILERIVTYTKSPLSSFIHFLNPYVSLLIIPLFAFANAGISIGSINLDAWSTSSVSYGIILGLCLGKPIGILLFSFVSHLLKITSLPEGVNWKHIISVGFLGGIGFTMSLFLTNLSFPMDSMPYAFSKLSVLIGSTISGIIGIFLLWLNSTPKKKSKKRK